MTATTPTPKTPKRTGKAATPPLLGNDQAGGAMPPPPPPPPIPPAGAGGDRHVSPRLLRVALAVSVALNLLVAGIVAGAVFHKSGQGGSGAMTRDLGFGPFTEALAPEDRRALRQWLQQRAPQLRSANAQRRADIIALQSALRADPFVPQDLTRALEAMRGRLQTQLDLGHQALAEVIMAMPPAERMALADRLSRGLRRGDDDRANGSARKDDYRHDSPEKEGRKDN